MKFFKFLSGKKTPNPGAKKHVKNLLELANVDGHFDPRENEFLEQIATRENVSKKSIKEITAEEGEILDEIPEDEEEKFLQFYDLIRMMLADGYIHELEMQLIKTWAEKFGYKNQHHEELIDSLIQNIENGQDAKSARQRVYWMIKKD